MDKIIFLFKWFLSRFYIIFFFGFLLVICFVDIKRFQDNYISSRLNNLRPDFEKLILFTKTIDKKIPLFPYEKYFKIVNNYIPENVIIENLYAYILFYQDQTDLAEKLFSSSRSKSKGHFFYSSYNLGVVSYYKGRYLQAIEYFQTAINANINLTLQEIYNSIVYRQIFANQKFDINIENEYVKALSHCYVLLISSYLHMNSYEMALKTSLMAISNPKLYFQDAYYFLAGQASLNLKLYEQSTKFFNKNLELQPKNHWSYLYLSRIYSFVGYQDVSADLLKMYIDLNSKTDKLLPYDSNIPLKIF